MKALSTSDLNLRVRHSSGCRYCGFEFGFDEVLSVEIVSASAQESAWTVKGKGSFRGQCPNCAGQLKIVEQLVPIHCSGLRCPSCKKPEHLSVQVRTLNTERGVFEFEALLECAKCTHKTALKKVLGKLAELLSIEIGLTGISIKAKGKKTE